jgi:putative ABC transport system permease protein
LKPILFRAGARYHLQHPWQLALALLGIALGVAVVAAVDLAVESSRRAFTLSTEAVSGRATHEVIGGPAGLPDSLLVGLRPHLGGGSAAPVVDRYIRLPDAGGHVLRLLGVDPFAEAPFRPYVAPAAGQADVGALLTGAALLLEAGTAARLGITAGDSVRISSGARTTMATIAGVLEPADALTRRALADVALADISTAQEIVDAIGVIDRIELRLDGDAGVDVRDARGDNGPGVHGGARDDATNSGAVSRIRASLPPGARLLEAGARTGATLRMTRAFETNLAALSLVALVFGMFLIYNAVTFSLVQRRPLIALLRAQGVTAREILVLVLLEAAVIGTVATALGLAAGVLLGTGLVGLVARTINDLYFTLSVTPAGVAPLTLAKGALLGIGATLAAALPAAREAANTPPRVTLARSTLERRVRGRAARLAMVSGVIAAIAALLLLVPSRSVVLGFAALFTLILAAALVTPGATLLLMALLRPVAARLGPVARLAARGVSASLSRTAPAIAALSIALAVGTAVTIMIGSFRSGVVTWLERSLQADLYVSAPDLGADRTDVVLDPALVEEVAGLDGVAGVSAYRHVSLLLDDDIVRLIGAELHAPHRAAFEVLDAGAGNVWDAFAGGGLLVSESFAYRRGIAAGDSVALPTDRGAVPLPVAAVYRDYASEHGVIFIDRERYDTLWDDDGVTSLGVFVTDAADAEAVLARMRALPAAAGAVMRSNRALRESTLVVFDRTFAITGVLRVLALLVAFIGVTGALMALQLERAREIGVLRTTGLTPAQVWALVTTQTGLMGLAAAVLAAPVGLVMAWTMVYVINRRSFGWTFDMVVGAAPFAQALAVGVGAALLAGIYPAWRMARLRPADAMREE